MFYRNITSKIEKALSRSPVVLLIGARQTGKTTLMKQIGKARNYNYITFDDIRFLSAAKSDPIGFIQAVQKPVILDEVQRVPEIFLAIKQDVDQNRIPGMYALTGSANPLLIPKIGDSLAGRMEIFSLFPLSQGEILGQKDQFIDNAFNNQLPLPFEVVSKENLYQKITIGGYPSVQVFDYEGRESWFNSYITTILQRDVKDISQISGISQLPMLLSLLATRAGSILNVSELSRTAGISASTLNRYLILLQMLFLINFQSSWSSNLGKRLVKSPKIYLIDSGLLSFLLGINLQDISDLRFAGSLLENFVQSELLKQSTWNNTRVKSFYFRTNSGIEVDIVLEDFSGNLVCIEIKNSSTVNSTDFKGLKYIQELTGSKFLKGIVLYTGSELVPFGPKLIALPINSLWAV